MLNPTETKLCQIITSCVSFMDKKVQMEEITLWLAMVTLMVRTQFG